MPSENVRRTLAVEFAFTYAVIAGLCALLKLSTPLWSQPVWIVGELPWIQIILGPGIASGRYGTRSAW